MMMGTMLIMMDVTLYVILNMDINAKKSLEKKTSAIPFVEMG